MRSRSCASAFPGVSERLAAQAAAFVAALRELDITRSPGVAETIDWTDALTALGCRDLDAETVEQTLGAVLKYREDFDTVQGDAMVELIREARAVAAAAQGMTEPFTRQLVTFGRVLREAGLEVGPGRLTDALQGLDAVGSPVEKTLYWTLRTTLVARREEIEPFDRAFAAWFLAPVPAPAASRRPAKTDRPAAPRVRRDAKLPADPPDAAGEPESIGYSAHEVLRRRDFASMNEAESARCGTADRRDRRSAAAAPLAASAGTSQRRTLDMRRLARSSLATGGDAVHRRFRRRTLARRKLVVLCGAVRAEWEAYSRAMLLYLHALDAIGPRGRGVRIRHPADAGHHRVGHPRPRRRAARRS